MHHFKQASGFNKPRAVGQPWSAGQPLIVIATHHTSPMSNSRYIWHSMTSAETLKSIKFFLLHHHVSGFSVYGIAVPDTRFSPNPSSGP